MNDFLRLLLEDSTGPAAVGFQDLLLRLLIAFLSGMVVAWVYIQVLEGRST